MSLKLSDITSAKAARFPDFIVDAEDEQGNALELHFRAAYTLDEAKRAEMAEAEKAFSESRSDADLREVCIKGLRIAAREPHHFEVLEKNIADNTGEGELDLPLWLTAFELYREQTQLGEA